MSPTMLPKSASMFRSGKRLSGVCSVPLRPANQPYGVSSNRHGLRRAVAASCARAGWTALTATSAAASAAARAAARPRDDDRRAAGWYAKFMPAPWCRAERPRIRPTAAARVRRAAARRCASRGPGAACAAASISPFGMTLPDSSPRWCVVGTRTMAQPASEEPSTAPRNAIRIRQSTAARAGAGAPHLCGAVCGPCSGPVGAGRRGPRAAPARRASPVVRRIKGRPAGRSTSRASGRPPPLPLPELDTDPWCPVSRPSLPSRLLSAERQVP